MAAKYQTKITKARFVVSPFSGRQMAEVGQSVIDSVFARWDIALDVNDRPAPPLTDRVKENRDLVYKAGKDLVGVMGLPRYGAPRGYRAFKQRKTGRTIRDLNLTGRLRRSIKVLSANENKAVLGPTDGIHTRSFKRGQVSFSEVLTFNQRRWRMWGVSPADKAKLLQVLAGQRPVRAQIVRAA